MTIAEGGVDDSIVIIGGGQAAVSAATTLRQGGHRGSIDIVAAEAVAPYQRPPLSKKYLAGDMDLERLKLKPDSFYPENDITLHLSTRAEAIDRRAGRVQTSAGSLSYDRIILATGSIPRRLPDEIGGALPGVFSVRDIVDIDTMAPYLVAGRRAVVVGGGYIGLEAAAVAARRGLQVTVLEQAPRILARVAAEPTATHVAALHRAEGVDIRAGASVTGIERSGDSLAVTLQDGAVLVADTVVVGIGVLPADALARAAGLPCDDGIVVDGQCRTGDPAIYAAGDVAAFPWAMPDGREQRIRLESVQNAIDQATHAARAILGEEAPYRPNPWFWSDQFDTRLQIAGLNLGHDRTVSRSGSRPGAPLGGRSVWYFAGTKLLAVDAIDDPRAYMQGKRWLEAKQYPALERLADDECPLKDTLVS
ncbi:MAG: FAD-dependent oxidoreductase [Pseudomonadota bacterium]